MLTFIFSACLVVTTLYFYKRYSDRRYYKKYTTRYDKQMAKLNELTPPVTPPNCENCGDTGHYSVPQLYTCSCKAGDPSLDGAVTDAS